MKVPLEWLKAYVRWRQTPEQLARALTLAGSEVTAIERVDGHVVFELEITPNRADCLSIIGLAREVAAMTGGKLHLPLVNGVGSRVQRRPSRSPITHHPTPKIRILDRAGCSQYIGRLIAGVAVGPSPEWMQRRLELCGIRPINNIVDITNYVLLEWGQPLHAFDWAALRQGTVLIRRAKPGERLRTLDGVDRALEPSLLVIADAQRPVAIAGVMGGTDTAVAAKTHEVLLESAQFDPRTIRLMSRALGLQSESSYRFERGVDPAGVELASQRAAQLLRELAGGVEVARIHAGQRSAPARIVSVDPQALIRRTGAALPLLRARRMLQSVGCVVRGTRTRWTVRAPSHRRDLSQAVDLVEELARLSGYERIPSALPTTVVAAQLPPHDAVRALRDEARCQLIACGLQEAVTWSLVPEMLVQWSGVAVRQAVRIINPLSQEQAFLRPALWPRLLQVAAMNLHRQQPGVALFEVGSVYCRSEEGHLQPARHVAIIMSGELSRHWQQGIVEADFFAVKGMLDTLTCRWGLRDAAVCAAQHPSLEPGWSAEWRLGGVSCGWLGMISAAVRDAAAVKSRVVVAEWSLDQLQAHRPQQPRYQPLPRTPAVLRDLSLIVESRHGHSAIARAIREAGGARLEEAILIDRYARPPIPQGSVSLTYALRFRDPTQTLTDAVVDQLQAAITQAVTRQFHATIRTA